MYLLYICRAALRAECMQAALRAECLRRRYAPNTYGGEIRRVLPIARPHENGNTIDLQAYKRIYPKRRYAPIVNQRNMGSGATAAAARRLRLRGCAAPHRLQQRASLRPRRFAPSVSRQARSSPSRAAADVRRCVSLLPSSATRSGRREAHCLRRRGAIRSRAGSAAAHRRLQM